MHARVRAHTRGAYERLYLHINANCLCAHKLVFWAAKQKQNGNVNDKLPNKLILNDHQFFSLTNNISRRKIKWKYANYVCALICCTKE